MKAFYKRPRRAGGGGLYRVSAGLSQCSVLSFSRWVFDFCCPRVFTSFCFLLSFLSPHQLFIIKLLYCCVVYVPAYASFLASNFASSGWVLPPNILPSSQLLLCMTAHGPFSLFLSRILHLWRWGWGAQASFLTVGFAPRRALRSQSAVCTHAALLCASLPFDLLLLMSQ